MVLFQPHLYQSGPGLRFADSDTLPSDKSDSPRSSATKHVADDAHPVITRQIKMERGGAECTSRLHCEANALVADSLVSLFHALATADPYRETLKALLGGEIKSLSRNRTKAARHAVMILGQIVNDERGR